MSSNKSVPYEPPGIDYSAKIDFDLLPESIKEIKDLIGWSATLKLVKHYGGIRVYIPENVGPNNSLALNIGLSEAKILAEHFNGTDPYIPKLSELLRAHRNREIIQKYDSGVPARRLARQYKLSVRQIWYILKQPLSIEIIEKDKDQMALF